MPGIEADTSHRIAPRLGYRDAFPTADLRVGPGPVRELAARELAARWRRWCALTAACPMRTEGCLV
ncbi:hypothetical protein OG762_06020 [Streptomyces sp. NBC_01136]|uniref:hypothetical protein n=1 Tax=unclassified Streptomyces TaxID=2593676 RepID=UPI003252B88F|nr:hypothetical protein OG762_06020 [Streptomyces sp. NBC_01136]